MPRGQQPGQPRGIQRRRDGVVNISQPRPRRDEVNRAQRFHRHREACPNTGHAVGQAAQNSSDFLVFFDAQLFDLVAEINHNLRFHEQSRARRRRIMDDAAERPPVVGLDGDAVAVAALHNHRVLQHGFQRPGDNAV